MEGENILYKYNMYNMSVTSEYKLPCDPNFDENINTEHNITIKQESNLLNVESVALVGRRYGIFRSYDVGDGILLCAKKSTKIKFGYNTNEILVNTQEDGVTEMTNILIGQGLSIISLLKGIIPLHAASFEIENKRIGIIADSGSGKSTLLWALLDDGAKFVTDDVLPVFNYNDKVLTQPSVSIPSKLWKEEIHNWGIKPYQYRQIIPGLNKYHVFIDQSKKSFNKKEIQALFLLKPHEKQYSNEVITKKKSGSSALLSLLKNTHSLWTVPNKQQIKLLPEYSKIVNKVPIYTLAYHKNRDNIPNLINEIKKITLEN